MKVLTTLAENKYFLGLSALINSVVKQGTYIDKIVVGYRGELPAWLPKLSKSKNGESCILPSGIELELVVLNGQLHMVHEKPKWFKHLVEVLEPNADEYFFFDSDIVILRRMSFFGEWIQQGVALCEDVNYSMNYTHPIRKQWIKLAKAENYQIVNELDCYINSGFLGWKRENSDFIHEWENCFQILAKESGDMKEFRVKDRTHTVLSANQDSFNLATMITKQPISIVGPEGMSFHYGMQLMSHPIGPKPWSRAFIFDFIKGKPPRAGDVIFWENVNGTELTPVSVLKQKSKFYLCSFLRLLSRFYSQNK